MGIGSSPWERQLSRTHSCREDAIHRWVRVSHVGAGWTVLVSGFAMAITVVKSPCASEFSAVLASARLRLARTSLGLCGVGVGLSGVTIREHRLNPTLASHCPGFAGGLYFH